MQPDGKRKILVVPAAGGTPRPVADTPIDQRYPGWSPDGRSLVFNSDALGRQQVYVVSRDRAGRWGPVRQLTRDGGASPRWSPDGRTIAYVRPDGLWTIPARGGTPRQHLRIGPGQGDFLGAVQWSPDGRTLYYKWIDERSRATIQALPLAGGPSRLVVRLEDPRRQSLRPEFATDGRHVYLSIAERESDVWVMELGAVRE